MRTTARQGLRRCPAAFALLCAAGAACAEDATVRVFSGVATNLAGDLVAGATGTGNVVRVVAGAQVGSPAGAVGAAVTASANAAVVDAAAWRNAGSLTVGERGAGNRLDVLAGGTAAALDGDLGRWSSATGNVAHVGGSGSCWTNELAFYVGRGGGGNRLLVAGGAALHCLDGAIGEQAGSDGNAVLLADPGTFWNCRGSLAVGHRGAANVLEITAGARASARYAMIGASATAAGCRATVSGGSQWNVEQDLFVGVSGPGARLDVLAGALVTAARAVVGDFSAAAGCTVTVSAATLAVSGPLAVGVEGPAAALEIGAGGVVEALSLTVGGGDGATGNVVRVNGGRFAAKNASGDAAVTVRGGTLALDAGSFDADRLVVEAGGRAVAGAAFASIDAASVEAAGGIVELPAAAVLAGSLSLSDGGLLAGPAGAAWSIGGDFLCSSENPALRLTDKTFTFPAGTPHAFEPGCPDAGGVPEGFTNRTALAGLRVEGTVVLQGVAYAAALAGAGVLQIGTGSVLYCLDTGGWTGSVELSGDGRLVRVGAADLALSSRIAAEHDRPAEGEELVWHVTVSNSGPQTATAVRIDLRPADGLDPVGWEVTQGDLSAAGDTWDIGALAAGANAALAWTGRPGAGTSGATLTNEAAVAGLAETDPEAANDRASSTVTIDAWPQVAVPGPLRAPWLEPLAFFVTGCDDAGVPQLAAPQRPAGSLFTDNTDGTGAFAWVPGEVDAGLHRVTFTAADGRFVVTGTVDITVVSPVPWPAGGHTVAGRRPLFLWAPTVGATWYQLWLSRNGLAFHSQWQAGTNATWSFGGDLPGGRYTWWVRPWGPAIGMGAWTGGWPFEVALQPAGTPSPLSPAGTVAVARPDFTWEPGEGASWHYLWVARDGAEAFRQWVQGAASFRFAADLKPGRHEWWMRAWNVDGYSPWSAPAAFDYFAAAPLAPLDTVTAEARPLFTWQAPAAATWHQLWLQRDGRYFTSPWVPSAATWQPPRDLPAGTYQWWVRPWGAPGMGPWSPPATFTRSVP